MGHAGRPFMPGTFCMPGMFCTLGWCQFCEDRVDPVDHRLCLCLDAPDRVELAVGGHHVVP